MIYLAQLTRKQKKELAPREKSSKNNQHNVGPNDRLGCNFSCQPNQCLITCNLSAAWRHKYSCTEQRTMHTHTGSYIFQLPVHNMLWRVSGTRNSLTFEYISCDLWSFTFIFIIPYSFSFRFCKNFLHQSKNYFVSVLALNCHSSSSFIAVVNAAYYLWRRQFTSKWAKLRAALFAGWISESALVITFRWN